MNSASARLPESQKQAIIVRMPSQGVDGVRNGHVYIDVFSFESAEQIPSGTRLIIQYRITGTAMWVTSRAIVLGCVPGTDPVVVQGRLVQEFRSDSVIS